MRILNAAAAITVALLSLASFAKADPFVPATVPATAKWVIHIDMDAVRNTKLWDLFQERFIAPNQNAFDHKVQAVETITGMKFPRDLHDVTLFGTSYEKDQAVIVVHATVNQQTIHDMLSRDPEFHSDPHNDHDILTWRDKDKDQLMYGAFFGEDHVIISQSQKLVESALDALDAKVEVLKVGSALVPVDLEKVVTPAVKGSAGTVIYLAGKDLSTLPDDKGQPNPMLAQTQSACLTVSEKEDKIVTKATLKVKDEKAAQKMEALANGTRAMISLAASGEKADDKVKAADAALENLLIHRTGDTISAELPISLEALKNFAEAQHLGDAPAKNKLP